MFIFEITENYSFDNIMMKFFGVYFVLKDSLIYYWTIELDVGYWKGPITPGCSQQTFETLEDSEIPWMFFSPGKILWKTLKLQPTPEKLCSDAGFPRINI